MSVALLTDSSGLPVVDPATGKWIIDDEANFPNCPCCNDSSECVYEFNVTYTIATHSYGSVTYAGPLCATTSAAYTPRNTWLYAGGTIGNTTCRLSYFTTGPGAQPCDSVNTAEECTDPPAAPGPPTFYPSTCGGYTLQNTGSGSFSP